MNGQTLDQLATRAADLAMRGAVDYLRQRGKVDAVLADPARLDRLITMLRETVPVALREALDDAKEAHDAGMGAVGAATFAASLRLAGVNAGRSVDYDAMPPWTGGGR